MIRKKTNAKQGNKRKSSAKPKAAVNDTKTAPKAAKVEVEPSFLIRWRFHLLLFLFSAPLRFLSLVWPIFKSSSRIISLSRAIYVRFVLSLSRLHEALFLIAMVNL